MDPWFICNRHFSKNNIYHFKSINMIDYFINYSKIEYRFSIFPDKNILRINIVDSDRENKIIELQLNKFKNLTPENSVLLLQKILNNKAFI